MVDRLRQMLRQSNKNIRSHLNDRVVKSKSEIICRKIQATDIYRRSKHIAFYAASNGEVSLKSLWKSAPMQGKFCYFPVLEGELLLFLPANPKTKFINNKYGIPEPDVERDKAIEPSQLDLVLMPLVAFDEFGNRLGMGKGYYDKTLKDTNRNHNAKVKLVGVAYEFQKEVALPNKHWDVPLDGAVTENGLYVTKSFK